MADRPVCRRLWDEFGGQVRADDDVRSLMDRLELAHWKAAELITRRNRMQAEPAVEREDPPAPTERGTKVERVGDELHALHTDDEVNARIMNVDDLVKVANIDLDVWEITGSRVNTWGVVTKDDDGNPTVTRLWQVAATLRPRVVPLVPLDWEPPPVFVVPPALREVGTVRRAVILPDMQIGGRWRDLSSGRPWLEPYHDRAAIDAALQVVDRVQPDVVILLGDNLDLQALSTRWAFGDEARQTTNLAIREYAWLLRRLREIAPTAEIVYLLGNHESRLEKYLTERAGELAALEHADGRPALALGSLLGLDALQIEAIPYPMPYWLWGRVEIEHGRTVRAGGGATAAELLRRREHSVIQGHIHRAELAQRTIETPGGPRRILAASPGCLCRTDGVVPGGDRPDWQQGVGVLTLIDGADEDLQLVRIQHGRAYLGAEVLVGRDYAEEIAASVRAPALLRTAA